MGAGQQTAAGDRPTAKAGSRRAYPLFRRRKFLVNRRYQLRASALVVSVVLVLLVFLNLSIYSASVASTSEILSLAPEFEAYVKAQDRSLIFLIMLGSLVFLVGVFLVSILETHKTAGACVNLSRRIEEIARGEYNTYLKLRRDDNLRDLEPLFNRMCEALQQRTWDDVETLESLAERIGDGDAELDPGTVAKRLRAMAAEQRQRVEPPATDGPTG